MEAAEGGVELMVVITEGVPAHDEAWFFNKLKADYPGVQLLGPNCPGLISPGKANVGITAGHIAKSGGPVGIVSRSGTLTYQALYELKQQDIDPRHIQGYERQEFTHLAVAAAVQSGAADCGLGILARYHWSDVDLTLKEVQGDHFPRHSRDR